MRKALTRKIGVVLFTLVFFTINMCAVSASAFNFTPIKKIDQDGNPIKLELRSESVYMMNMDTGDVIIDIESDKQRVPASLTKVMTAVVLLDEFDGDKEKLESTSYTVGTEAFDELYGTGASTADIQPNETINCYDLLCALMLPSACEAANILAIGMCGSIDNFVDKMNDKAKELEMNDSHFSNAHGLSGDNNYTTCEDMAKLCTYAINSYEVFNEVVSMYEYVLSPTEQHPDGTYIYNTNLMLSDQSLYYYSYCRGIKTGTLDTAGRCLASYSVYDGKRYLIVSMGAPMDKLPEDIEKGNQNPDSVYAADTVYYNLIDHINLYEWAYSFLEEAEFVDKNSEIREAKVEYGTSGRDYVTLQPEYSYKKSWPTYIPTDSVKQEIEVYENVVAPVYQGDKLGVLRLEYEGEVIEEIPLIATETVGRSASAEKLAVAKAFPKSTEFKFAVVLIVVFAVAFTVIHVVRVQKKYMKKK
ncbi:MAG: D-alanyl-D-alanine carboxypeptidase family protein [Oscillospiraceae bacterium]